MVTKTLASVTTGCVFRYRSISEQSRALLPATCTTWFLSMCVDILVPNSWFGYRRRSSCSSSLLFGLCCTSSMLSWYRDYADSSAVFSSFQGIVWLTHAVRRLITSIGCRPWSRKLLCFRKWTDCHFTFCRWLSFITVFAVPSCSPRWIQQSTGATPWFLCMLCAHLFSNDNSSCLGSYGYFKLTFFGLQYSRHFHLQYSCLQRTLVHEGASWLW